MTLVPSPGRHLALRTGPVRFALALLSFPAARAHAGTRADIDACTETATTPTSLALESARGGRAETRTATFPDVRKPAPPPVPRGPTRIAAAARRQGRVTIDGALDEMAWAAAPVNGDFWQRAPDEGKKPVHPTEFRLLYDDSALYVGVRAYDPEPARIRALLTRRDVDSSSDWIAVEIDSYHDRRTSFSFAVNAAGVQADTLYFNDVEKDTSWDAVWESGARIDAQGWTAELRIPYSQLRFARAADPTWGLQVVRRVQRTKEISVWSPWPVESSQLVSLYGNLVGIRGVGTPRRIELVPYAVLGADLRSPDQGDPVLDRYDTIARMGIDARLGLGSSFTLSGTINPDFGQVEADPSEVNLSAQESFFPEKRPFFLEGTDIFRFSLGQGDGTSSVETLFYTRRIGSAPHTDPYDYGDYTDAPVSTTIYGAAKLSGKTPGGWSLGVLDAVTGQEDGRVATKGERQSRPMDSSSLPAPAERRRVHGKGESRSFCVRQPRRRTSCAGVLTSHWRDHIRVRALGECMKSFAQVAPPRAAPEEDAADVVCRLSRTCRPRASVARNRAARGMQTRVSGLFSVPRGAIAGMYDAPSWIRLAARGFPIEEQGLGEVTESTSR